jgi:lactoylglutathione lyase
MIIDVLHFSFTVSDIERAIAWYRDVLGLELVHRQRGDNAYTRTLVGMPEAVIEAAQFRIPGVEPRSSTHMLELVQYVAPSSQAVPLATNNVGIAHLAFVVADIDAEYERLRAHGVSFVSAPVAISEGANAGGAACYFRDPDGITLELLEPSPERKQALGLDDERGARV